MLILHEILHFLTYALLFLIVYAVQKNKMNLTNFITGLIATIFLDLDHLIDYFLHNGIRFSLSEFLTGQNFMESGKAYVIFHGWEFVLIIIVAYILIKKQNTKNFLLSIIIGLTAHLFFDSVANGMGRYFYFISYRIATSFVLYN